MAIFPTPSTGPADWQNPNPAGGETTSGKKEKAPIGGEEEGKPMSKREKTKAKRLERQRATAQKMYDRGADPKNVTSSGVRKQLELLNKNNGVFPDAQPTAAQAKANAPGQAPAAQAKANAPGQAPAAPAAKDATAAKDAPAQGSTEANMDKGYRTDRVPMRNTDLSYLRTPAETMARIRDGRKALEQSKGSDSSILKQRGAQQFGAGVNNYRAEQTARFTKQGYSQEQAADMANVSAQNLMRVQYGMPEKPMPNYTTGAPAAGPAAGPAGKGTGPAEGMGFEEGWKSKADKAASIAAADAALAVPFNYQNTNGGMAGVNHRADQVVASRPEVGTPTMPATGGVPMSQPSFGDTSAPQPGFGPSMPKGFAKPPIPGGQQNYLNQQQLRQQNLNVEYALGEQDRIASSGGANNKPNATVVSKMKKLNAAKAATKAAAKPKI